MDNMPNGDLADWWPEFLVPLTNSEIFVGDYAIVAKIDRRNGPASYVQLFTALASPEQVPALASSVGGIGNRVDTSGPHPEAPLQGTTGSFEPRFWVLSEPAVSGGLEPLVAAWRSGPHTVLQPDQGFLMTYGLTPRYVQTDGGFEIHWDDPTLPEFSIVIARPLATHTFQDLTPGSVRIRVDYLRDYATLRGKALLQVYYIEDVGNATGQTLVLIASGGSALRLPGREIHLHLLSPAGPLVKAGVSGVRILLEPGEAPVSAGRWDYGALMWPGYPEPLTADAVRSLGQERVTVRDSVLAVYEGRPGFEINPEIGAVSYRSQWVVGYCDRIGRDLIAVEIRKLYEGCRPDIVRHWNQHAVGRLQDESATANSELNVAVRAKRVTYSLLRVGELLARIASRVIGKSLTSADTVRLSRSSLEYHGWWKPAAVDPITWHIPLDLAEQKFLDRCVDLYKLVGESLSEALLRQLLLQLGTERRAIESFRSFKLLDRVVQLATAAAVSGLSLFTSYRELEIRRADAAISTPVDVLLALNSLRQLASHQADSSRSETLNEALRIFGVDPASVLPGWGLAADRVYDSVAEALEQIAEALGPHSSS